MDGRRLRESNLVPHQCCWVAVATGLLSGTTYIAALKVWGIHRRTKDLRERSTLSCLYCQGLLTYKCPVVLVSNPVL